MTQTLGVCWIKCDGCSREYQTDARWVFRGVGDPPFAHHSLTREPMTCPWCRHVGVRVVTGSGNGPGATPERRSTPAGSGSAGTSGAAPSLDETGPAATRHVADLPAGSEHCETPGELERRAAGYGPGPECDGRQRVRNLSFALTTRQMRDPDEDADAREVAL